MFALFLVAGVAITMSCIAFVATVVRGEHRRGRRQARQARRYFA